MTMYMQESLDRMHEISDRLNADGIKAEVHFGGGGDPHVYVPVNDDFHVQVNLSVAEAGTYDIAVPGEQDNYEDYQMYDIAFEDVPGEVRAAISELRDNPPNYRL